MNKIIREKLKELKDKVPKAPYSTAEQVHIPDVGNEVELLTKCCDRVYNEIKL